MGASLVQVLLHAAQGFFHATAWQAPVCSWQARTSLAGGGGSGSQRQQEPRALPAPPDRRHLLREMQSPCLPSHAARGCLASCRDYEERTANASSWATFCLDFLQQQELYFSKLLVQGCSTLNCHCICDRRTPPPVLRRKP